VTASSPRSVPQVDNPCRCSTSVRPFGRGRPAEILRWVELILGCPGGVGRIPAPTRRRSRRGAHCARAAGRLALPVTAFHARSRNDAGPFRPRRSSGLTPKRVKPGITARLNDRIHRSAIKIMRPIISSVKSQIGTMGPCRDPGPETNLGADPRTLVGGALIARTRGDVRHWASRRFYEEFSKGQLLTRRRRGRLLFVFVSHVLGGRAIRAPSRGPRPSSSMGQNRVSGLWSEASRPPDQRRRHGSVLAPLSLGAPPKTSKERRRGDRDQRPLPFDGIAAAPRGGSSTRPADRNPAVAVGDRPSCCVGGMRPQQRWGG